MKAASNQALSVIAKTGNVDPEQLKTLTMLLDRQAEQEKKDDETESDKVEVEKEAQKSSKIEKAQVDSDSNQEKKMAESAPTVDVDAETVGPAKRTAITLAADLDRIFQEAEAHSAALAEPRGMFKNLSPDMDFERDGKQGARRNTTIGKQAQPSIQIKLPVNLSKQARELPAKSKLQYKVNRAMNDFTFAKEGSASKTITTPHQVRTRSQLILAAKAETAKKAAAEEKAIVKSI